MNQKAFENIISFYKANYAQIEKKEIYKWKAVQTFQENWDIEAEDFYSMLSRSLKDTGNLMSAENYYPRKWILWMAKMDGEAVRGMFRELYDLTIDFKKRILGFREKAEHFCVQKDVQKYKKHYQDDRAIMVYLNMRYPDKYYLYKYKMFKNFVEYVDFDDSPKPGEIENLFKFQELCDYIHSYIMHEPEILRLYEARREKYYDPEYHLLVQDIIYSTYHEAAPEMPETAHLIKPKIFTHEAVENPINFHGKFIDYAEQEKWRKLIGDLGEQFVFSQEREKVKRYKLSGKKTVQWISRDKGDGLGFDILSYDENGNEMYIEVKTTTGGEKDSFFITANELEKSRQCQDNYYLYRVFDFDLKMACGKYSVRRGSLEDLCQMPFVYRVDFQ